MNVEGKKKLETEKRKNSKFKPKTPEFGVFCPLHAEKNGHKTSLYYRPLLVRYSPGGPSCCYYLGWEDFVPELRETGLDPAVQTVPVKKKRSVLVFSYFLHTLIIVAVFAKGVKNFSNQRIDEHRDLCSGSFSFRVSLVFENVFFYFMVLELFCT